MIMYETLMGMSGEKCYTLTADKPADMYVDDQKVTIVYPSGNSLDILRSLVMQAINMLMLKKKLTVADVHEEITQGNGARTDRLMAVIRKLPGVTFDRRPRVLYYESG
jgi:hypothetical protein